MSTLEEGTDRLARMSFTVFTGVRPKSSDVRGLEGRRGSEEGRLSRTSVCVAALWKWMILRDIRGLPVELLIGW